MYDRTSSLSQILYSAVLYCKVKYDRTDLVVKRKGKMSTMRFALLMCVSVQAMDFEDFLATFDKKYSQAEKKQRRSLFEASLKKINAHNKREVRLVFRISNVRV